MQEANETRDKLIKEFAESYMGKLFYFCLKKTGSHTEAEDLTQDVALNVLMSLNKGNIPTSFSAWVWQIARNRYSLWAKNKNKQRESVTGADVGDYEIEDKSQNILDKIIKSEQTALLQRELAFIKSEYRNIVVAYYIENKNIRDIALSLSLSVSAVQQRLHRARIILKEGMEMAREFGKRSYNPQNITFGASGSQPSGLPWSVINRTIPHNILLQASNNPSTLEELSMELGIALPYMEEEVEILHRATLLEKQGDKYITNFFILDKECRTEIYYALREASAERSGLIREFIDDKMAEIRAIGIAEAHIDDNTVRWWLIPDLIDLLIVDASSSRSNTPPGRANGESWGIVGYETTNIPEKIMMGHNGCGNGKNMFWTYKYSDYSLWDQCGEPEYEETMLICDCIRNHRQITSFSNVEENVWKGIDGKYAHASDDGYMIPDILVITKESHDQIHRLFREHVNYEMLIKNMKVSYLKLEEIFKKYSHKVLHNNIGYYIRMELYKSRMMAIHDLVECDYLKIPKDTSKSTLGMHVILG